MTDAELERLRNNHHQGKVSVKAQKRISNAIDWMLYLSADKKYYSPKHGKSFNFKLNFITLTLASKQRHSDQEIKNRLLNQFLLEMKRDHAVKNYLWRAESQRNGNIHFHVITDRFIPWSTLRKSWNRIQEKLGYVAAYGSEMREHHRNGFQPRPELFKTWSLEAQKSAYEAGMRGNWSNPNSTDIHAIHKIRNLSAYLSKYFTKPTEQTVRPTKERRTYTIGQGADRNVFTVTCVETSPYYRPVHGKLWGLSHSLSKLKGVILEISSNIQAELTALYEANKAKFKFSDYYTVAYMPLKKWLSKDLKHTYAAFMHQLAELVSSDIETGKTLSIFSNLSPPVALAS